VRTSWCAQYHGSTSFENGTLSDVSDLSIPLVEDNDLAGYAPESGHVPRSQLEQYANVVYQIDVGFASLFRKMLTSLLQNTIFNENTPGLYEAGVKLLPSPYRSEYDNSELDNINMGRNNLLYYANGGNLSRTLSNVALGVTNQMRSSLGSTNVTGTATYTIVYIKVV
jgi:hypothetical protein